MKISIGIRNQGNKPGRAEAGFSLIEIMVGLVIGMLGIMVIFQVFAVSEGQKRTTTSGSDAQQNGNYALYLLASQVQAAGSGFASRSTLATAPNLFGCTIAGLPAVPAYMTPAPPVASLIPVLIADGGGGASDSITVMYGAAAGIGSSVSLTAVVSAGSTAMPVSSTFGFNQNDYVLAVEQAAGVPCTLEQVSAPPPAIGSLVVTPALGVGYSSDAVLLNLGPGPTGAAPANTNGPVMTEFAVLHPAGSTSFSLAALDLLGRPPGAGAPTVLVDEIVNIQAQYGIDAVPAPPNGDGVIEAWVEPTGIWAAAALTPTLIAEIKAIRVGIVVRSGLVEKSTGGACTTTVAAPVALPAVVAGGASPAKPAAPAMDTSGIPNFGCYRYKVFETVIPVRNAIL